MKLRRTSDSDSRPTALRSQCAAAVNGSADGFARSCADCEAAEHNIAPPVGGPVAVWLLSCESAPVGATMCAADVLRVCSPLVVSDTVL